MYHINRIKDKKCMIISIYAEKNLTKANTFFECKNTHQTRNRWELPQCDKGHP